MTHDTPNSKTLPLERDLETAIGLIWGHLKARQFRQGATLAAGCLAVWPGQPMLVLLGAYAAGELGEPLAAELRAWLDRSADPGLADLAALVLRRAAPGIAGEAP